MKNWKFVAGFLLAVLMLAATPLAVIAAGGNPIRVPISQIGNIQLVIVHPEVVSVGQDMQLRVLGRAKQMPANGAQVWAIDQNKMEGVRGAFQQLIVKGTDNIAQQDYLNILGVNGIRMGNTDEKGKLTFAFSEPAHYELVAIKNGFRPGFSNLAVREILSIIGVKKASPNQEVTVGVKQRGTQNPVPGAEMWAVDFSNELVLKDKVAELMQSNQSNLENLDWNIALNQWATLLGTTDSKGQLTHRFSQGKYLLVATRKGSRPAVTNISIVAPKPIPSPSMTSN